MAGGRCDVRAIGDSIKAPHAVLADEALESPSGGRRMRPPGGFRVNLSWVKTTWPDTALRPDVRADTRGGTLPLPGAADALPGATNGACALRAGRAGRSALWSG